MPLEYEFGERLQMSQGICTSKSIANILMQNISGARAVKKSVEQDDRNGTDYWVIHARGEPYSIDVKARQEDYKFKPEPYHADDLALETWSVVEKNIIGWTRNPNKMTDYVLWFWQDSGRWYLIPFAMLCAVFETHWEEWRKQYKTRTQFTPRHGGGYHSECVFVPRREVWAEIYRCFGGNSVLVKSNEQKGRIA